MKPIIFTLIIVYSLLLFNCKKDDERIILKTYGGFPSTPENLTFLNSKYDDYNSAGIPGEYDQYDLFFSSNRNSLGKDFDIIYFPLSISYRFDNKVMSISERGVFSTSRAYFTEKARTLINTSNNELGPYLFDYNLTDYYLQCGYIFFYTQEQSDKTDLKFVINEYNSNEEHGYKQTGPYDISIFNTNEFNEGYCSISNDKIYYCSDKEGSYDIYEQSIVADENIIDYLTQPYILNPYLVPNINSEAQDKCPYVVDSFMVFTSNRPGGFGGYDLYYSKLVNGEWNEPKNFGSSINTEFDEYRPIVSVYSEIPNDLMIFSSNRVGGLGGFDLYYVGITDNK